MYTEKVVVTHIRLDSTNIHPVPVAGNLGSWFDFKLSTTKQFAQHTTDPEVSLQ